MKTTNSRTNQIIVQSLRKSSGIFSKLVGLLLTKSLPNGCGMWLTPCSGIHTFGMRYAIDAIYLDKNRKVVQLVKNLKPNRFAPFSWRTHSVLELPGGTLDRLDILPGDCLEMISD